MRSFKTAVSVALCFVFFEILHALVDFSFFNQANPIPVYACAAGIICMQNTVEDSVTSGVFRLFGNAVGGLLGIIALLALPYVPSSVQIIIIFFGILACMVICNVTKKQRSCAMACVVFVVVISVMGDRDPLVYALYRIFETVIGVVIAIAVNKFLVVPGFVYRLKDKILKGEPSAADDKAEAAASEFEITAADADAESALPETDCTAAAENFPLEPRNNAENAPAKPYTFDISNSDDKAGTSVAESDGGIPASETVGEPVDMLK